MEQARLTVVETVYHQTIDEDPTEVDSRYSRLLKSDEQPFVRRCKATETPQGIPQECWLTKASMVTIRNLEGVYPGPVLPSQEEKDEIAGLVIIVNDLWIVPPGETFRGTPKDLSKVTVSCLQGAARYLLNVFPE